MGLLQTGQNRLREKSSASLTQDYKQADLPKGISPIIACPALEAETNLSGGHTILRYLCDTRLPADNSFYPRTDIKKRAVIDMMLDWHLTTLSYCGKHVEVKLTGEEAFNAKYKFFYYLPEQFPKEIHKSLKMLDNEFFERKYWGSQLTNPTIADLLILSEVFTLNLINHDITKYPNVLSTIQVAHSQSADIREAMKPVEIQAASKGFSLYAPSQRL